MPAPLRPSPSRRRSTQSPVAHRLNKFGSIIRKPPPRVDSASSSDNKNVAEPPERSNAGFFFTRARKKSPPRNPDVLVPETTSPSAYPGRMRYPVSDRIPHPMLGEEVNEEDSPEIAAAAQECDARYSKPHELERDDEMSLHSRPGVASSVSEVEEHKSTSLSGAPTPRKSRAAVRFKIAGMVALGVQKMSAGTTNLARRTSLASGSGSRRHSSARETGASPRVIEEPLAGRLHAGPGGLFEPEPRNVHPAVRTLLERAASNRGPGGLHKRAVPVRPGEAGDSESVSPVSPQSSRTTRSHPRGGDQDGLPNEAEHEDVEATSPLSDRGVSSEQWTHRRRRPYRHESYRDGASRLKDPRQGPSSISHEVPATEDSSHVNTYESSRPLAKATSSSIRSKQRRWGGRFQRNVVGMDIFAAPVVEETPSTSGLRNDQSRNEWEALTSLKRVFNAFLYLPFRSRSHVTVSYIPARAKPDGTTASEPWYTPKPPKPLKNANEERRPSMLLGTDSPRKRRPHRARSKARKRRSSVMAQSALKVIERDPSRRSRYMTQDHLLAGQPIQVLSENAAPMHISPGGAPHLSHSKEAGSPHSAWFTQPAPS